MTPAAEPLSLWDEEETVTSPGFTLGPRAVVANDDPCMRHLVACLMAAEGLFVTEVETARELFDFVAAGRMPAGTPIDLIVTAPSLRDATYRSILRQLRQAGYGGRVVLLTSPVDEAACTEFHGLNAEYITTPFQVEEFCDLVGRFRSPIDSGEGCSDARSCRRWPHGRAECHP